jgi:hypothetical protein
MLFKMNYVSASPLVLNDHLDNWTGLSSKANDMQCCEYFITSFLKVNFEETAIQYLYLLFI